MMMGFYFSSYAQTAFDDQVVIMGIGNKGTGYYLQHTGN